MKSTITAKQDLDYKIPELPKAILTTVGYPIPLEALSEDTINKIFACMADNALEYRRSKTEDEGDQKKK